MANTASARKRVRQTMKATQLNASQKSRVRTSVKQVVKLSKEGKKEDAQAAYKQAQSLLDKSTHRNLFHKNQVARIKTHLVKRLKSITQ